MDEKGSKGEEVKEPPHTSTTNNTAEISGEERTPQVVRRLYLGTSGKTKFEENRSQPPSFINSRKKEKAALRQERKLSPIADTVKVKKKTKKVKKERDENTGHRALSSDTEPEEDIVSSDEDESGSDTESDDDSEEDEELGAARNGNGEKVYTQEAEMLKMITGDSDSDGLDEEPLDVLLSTIAIEDLMPGLGAEEERYCRTVNAVIVWKNETCKEEFDKMAAMVKDGGEKLRAQVANVAKLLLRQHRLRIMVVSAMISEMLRKAAAKCGKERKVLDYAQALVRQRTGRFKKMMRSG